MDESLPSLYARADVLRREIDDGGVDEQQVMFYTPRTCVLIAVQERLQECIALYKQCRDLVTRLALFSQNESLDDVSSSELKFHISHIKADNRYFLIDYYLGDLTEKRFTTIEDRKTFLLEAQVLPPPPKEKSSSAAHDKAILQILPLKSRLLLHVTVRAKERSSARRHSRR